MTKLQCDLCGGSLMMDDSGDFASCESCGMKFKRETVKKMIVELSGPIQIEGIAKVDNLVARAKEFEQAGKFKQAHEYYDRVLDLDLNHAEAKERYEFIEESAYYCSNCKKENLIWQNEDSMTCRACGYWNKIEAELFLPDEAK